MYRLMKSERQSSAEASGRQLYQQTVVATFDDLEEAVAACLRANQTSRARHYLLDDSGKELYGGAWID
ncbi:hypothetical protein Thimo_1535 [Thioflavicoccus mobilis 8321]|uniref:Uncharacterized protein n=1 Tax=Thioflavicoccus mobilis 8321 TaxID=765912 RepID=L0GU67_9GAMM|nr:hypothetical protein [Thioflavicoccus mobilis]AGA90318.1 hypothetical protein Thimo_1535 [Thioflavicoccus mobilis 8321]